METCRIRDCVFDVEPSQRTERGTCQRLEKAITCVNTINGDCAKNAFLAGGITLDSRLRTNQSQCFSQRFDEYFNQDGLCSFQDVQEYAKTKLFEIIFDTNIRSFFSALTVVFRDQIQMIILGLGLFGSQSIFAMLLTELRHVFKTYTQPAWDLSKSNFHLLSLP